MALFVPVVLLALGSAAFAAQQAGTPGGVVGGVVGGLVEAPVPPPPPPPPPGAVRVGGNVKQPTKTKNVPPLYPAIAQAARVQGVVIMEAVIGPDGRVADARVLRSIPLLDQAALDAVKQWEYTPTLKDGVAVPVIMTATVQFTLDTRLPPLARMTPDVRSAVLAELEKRRALWITTHPAAYSLRLTTVLPPGQTSVVVSTVRDGKAVSGPATMESVFDYLAESIRVVDLAAIAFDLSLGFPAEFQVVPPAATDAGVIVRVELMPLAP